jgi:hypothetical protein
MMHRFSEEEIAMRSVLLLLLATAACRDFDRDINNRKPVSATKPVEQAPARDYEPAPAPAPAPAPTTTETVPAETERSPLKDGDHEYVRVRSNFETTSRERLSKLDARIQELEQSASESGRQTAQQLRKDRDELAMRLDTIREQAKPKWDEFQSSVEDSFQRLENRLNDAVH